jgi:hypothetical protein
VVEAISFNGIAACMINIGTASESPIPIAVMEVRPTSKATLKGYRKKRHIKPKPNALTEKPNQTRGRMMCRRVLIWPAGNANPD